MIQIGSFSGGRLSALMVEKMLKKFDHQDLDIIFMDTNIEDDDNYRFIGQLMERWNKLCRVTRLCEGRDPYQVSSAQHLIPNSLIAPCTRRLKIEPFVNYLKSEYGAVDEKLTINIGYDFTEMHRCEPTKKAYEKFGWNVDFPMLWKPIEFRNYDEALRQDLEIEPPRMYRMGYSHANCGGMCVKQGAGDWLKTLWHFPERYARAEQWEREMRENPVNANYTILKRSVNNQIENLSLEQLRKDYEKNQEGFWNAEFICVRCGVGDFVE